MSRQITGALIALTLLVGATLAADATVAPPVRPTAEFTERVDVASGTWYCLPLVGDGQRATVSVASVGGDASQISIEQVGGGESSFADSTDLAPRSVTDVTVEGADDPVGVIVRWRGGPVTATWRVDGRQQRFGTNCVRSPAPQWAIAGADTTAGSNTTLRLWNPFDNEAVVGVSFATPEGRIDQVRSENVPVPARSVVTLGLRDLQPEQPDLGVVVDVQAGRVIAGALQQFGQPELADVELDDVPLPGDAAAPEGRVALPATAGAGSALSTAYAVSDVGTTSWVSVLNPSDEPARITVAVSDPVDGAAADDATVVGPYSTARVDLDGLSSSPEFGVTLTTDGPDVVATGLVARTAAQAAPTEQPSAAPADDAASESSDDASADSATAPSDAATDPSEQQSPAATAPADGSQDGGQDRARTGVTAAAMIVEPDALSAQAITAANNAQLALFNPGDRVVTATVAVDGQIPDAWSALEVEPGRVRPLSFDDAGVAAGGAVEVNADAPLVAAVRIGGDDPDAGLLLIPLVPANAWRGSSDALQPLRDRTLETRPVDSSVSSEQ